MTIITFSQEKNKDQRERITRLFNIVKTKSTPDLWFKVFFYKPEIIEHWGFNWEKDSPQLQFYFGDRFTFEEVFLRTDIEVGGYRGHYRYVEVFGHGFYDEEWKFLNKHENIKHVITLKIRHSNSDLDIAALIAHEFRHYLQYKKYGLSMTRHGNHGRRSRPVQVERDANNWAEKRIAKLKEQGLL
jgi:hypothetical protein